MLFPAPVVKEDLGTPFSPLLLQGEAQADVLLVFQDGIVGLVDVLGHFGSSALQGERVVRVPRLNAKLGQDPDAVGEFQRLIEHVLTFHIPLGDGVDIVVLQFAGDGVGIQVTVFNLELKLIFVWNIFPGCKEDLALHFSILYEKYVKRNQAAEVKDINVVFHSHLEVVQRLHFHDWSQSVEGQGDINTLVWHQRCVNGQGGARDDSEAVLIELNGKVGHVLQSLIGEVHLHVDVSLPVTECA